MANKMGFTRKERKAIKKRDAEALKRRLKSERIYFADPRQARYLYKNDPEKYREWKLEHDWIMAEKDKEKAAVQRIENWKNDIGFKGIATPFWTRFAFFILFLGYVASIFMYKDGYNIRSPFDTIVTIGKAFSDFGRYILDELLSQLNSFNNFVSTNMFESTDVPFFDGILTMFDTIIDAVRFIVRFLYLLIWCVMQFCSLLFKIIFIAIGAM